MFSMKVRYKYRLRPGKQAERYLLAEWDACRYVWNRMVDESQARYERGETFGAAQAQKYLTFLRASKTDKDGDSLSSDMRWQREYKRQIDITQLSQQVETYDIEVDWHALGRIALDCGITLKEGDIVPLPLFRFRRFVQTEFECSSDPTVFSAIAPSTSVSRRCWPHMD